MAADTVWDGKIEVEDYVERFTFGTGTEAGRLRSLGFTESMLWENGELVMGIA